MKHRQIVKFSWGTLPAAMVPNMPYGRGRVFHTIQIPVGFSKYYRLPLPSSEGRVVWLWFTIPITSPQQVHTEVELYESKISSRFVEADNDGNGPLSVDWNYTHFAYRLPLNNMSSNPLSLTSTNQYNVIQNYNNLYFQNRDIYNDSNPERFLYLRLLPIGATNTVHVNGCIVIECFNV